MRGAKFCSWIGLVVALVLVVGLGATPAFAAPKPRTPTPAGACGTVGFAQYLNQLKPSGPFETCDLDGDGPNPAQPCVVNADFTCNPSAERFGTWHFVLNQTTAVNGGQCGSIEVTFASCPNPSDNGTVVQAAGAMPDASGTCFYDVAGHVGCTLIGASDTGASSICTSGSQFVLSSSPCVIETLAVADFNNETGTLGCDPTANLTDPAGPGACVPLASDTECGITPVGEGDLPDANVDIAITNAPAGTTIAFHAFSQLGTQPPGQCVDICNPANEVTATALGSNPTGIVQDPASGPNFALSPVWTIGSISGDTLKAFQACIVDGAGIEHCGVCEEWPITRSGGGGGGCTRTIGFWMTHGDGQCHKGGNEDLWPTLSGSILSLEGGDKAALCAALWTQPQGDQCVQLERQLIGALLNELAFGTDVDDTKVAEAIAAIQADNQTACGDLISFFDTFNNSGDTVPLDQCLPTIE